MNPSLHQLLKGKTNKRAVSLAAEPVPANSPFSTSICLPSGSPFPFALFLTERFGSWEKIIPVYQRRYLMQKEELSFPYKQGEVSDWLRDSCPCRCRPISDLEEARKRLCPLSCPTAVITGRHHVTCVCRRGAAICVSVCVCVCLVPCLRACLVCTDWVHLSVYICNQESTAYTTCIFIVIGEGYLLSTRRQH